ncbi:MAG TPA: hypothetical protein VFC19_52615 [Candidatus Limnocylindrales bacterium]|nr:hypothetical protein [Candidatus Limnocylindrales bacterium]
MRFFLGTVGIVLALISGCGSGQTPGTETGQAGTGADPAVVWTEFVACARVNGRQDWPDPQVKPDGTATFGDFPAKAALEAVREKCGAILDKLPPAARPGGGGRQGPLPPPTEAHMKAMNEYTKCMRENGFDDWPDVHADGTFWLDDAFWTPEHRAKQAIADPKCRHLMPSN